MRRTKVLSDCAWVQHEKKACTLRSNTGHNRDS